MLLGKIENCYGIKNFDMETGINFSQCNKALIYAPNGVMKTSFAKVFEDLSKGEASKDRLLPNVTSSYTINYNSQNYSFNSDNPSNVPHCDSVYVVNSFADKFEFSKETVNTLLADEAVRTEYNDLIEQFKAQIKSIENELSSKSGFTKPRIKDALIKDLGLSDVSDWPDIINEIHELLKNVEIIPYLGEIKMAVLFSDKAIKEYEKTEFRKYIQQYIDRLSELLQTSELLTNSFTDRSAEALTKTFAVNDLFSARHKIILRDGTEIDSIDDWKSAVEKQIQRLYADETLHTAFDKLKKNLTANNEVDAARQIIIEYRQIIPLLFDIPKAKKMMWITYYSQMERSFDEYYKEITQFTDRIRILYEKAAAQSERWNKVVDEFNRRFRVPFTIQINNKSNYILKDEAPNISFLYKRGSGLNEETVDITMDRLLPSLSMGEKRALYLLYILFDLERIRNQTQNGQRFLVIADDIADSFDYKNKYAIVEYLADLSQNPGIDLLVLTHNFDFYRTVKYRLGINYNNCYIAQKDDSGIITMKVFRYQKDFFKEVIIAGIKGSDVIEQKRMLIASIPFYRNLALYCGNEDDYLKLTCFLHYKSNPIDTENAKLSDVCFIINQYLNGSTVNCSAEGYYSTVQLLASDVANDNDDISLVNKLIVAIASRLRAEKYLKQIIVTNEGSCQDSNKNQMRDWYERAKPYLTDDVKSLMDDISLITPESIHLNAFMYEPLIDVSIWTLNSIFSRIVGLDEIHD